MKNSIQTKPKNQKKERKNSPQTEPQNRRRRTRTRTRRNKTKQNRELTEIISASVHGKESPVPKMEPILLLRSLKNAAAIIFLLFSTECKTRQQANNTHQFQTGHRLRRNADNELRKHEGTQKPSTVYSNALPRVLRKLGKQAVSVGDLKQP
jgi:hypothetical protein